MYRLIVVDDEKFIRESILAFEWNEINVMPVGCFECGISALEYIKSHQVDVVLTDIRMPMMNGIDLIEKIKKYNHEMRVICVSGYSDYEYLRACMRAGANDYILKPVDKKELFETVENALLGRISSMEADSNMEDESQEATKEYHQCIAMAEEYIAKNYASSITLESVAEQVYLNPVYLSYLFKKVTGVKFSEYLNDCRIRKAMELLDNSVLRIGQISIQVGYKDSRYFSEIFKKRTGVTPNEYRNRNEK